MKELWLSVPRILVVLFFAICTPWALYLHPPEPRFLSKVLQLLTAWPVVVGFVALLFFDRFHSAIDTLIRNLSIRFPGGTHLHTQVAQNAQSPQPPQTDDSSSNSDNLVLNTEQQTQLRTVFEGLAAEHAQASEARDTLQKQLTDERFKTLLWKFQFLNIFYVPNTKACLKWIYDSTKTTRAAYHDAAIASISNLQERDAILNALVRYGSLKDELGTLTVTPEGHRFLQYIGFLPWTEG